MRLAGSRRKSRSESRSENDRRCSSNPPSPAPSHAPPPSPGTEFFAGEPENLREAVVCGDVELVRGLIEAGAPLEEKGSYGWTALHMSAKYGKRELVQMLVEAKADLRMKDNAGLTAADWAERKGMANICRILGGGMHLPKSTYDAASRGDHDEVMSIFATCASREHVEGEALKWALYRGDVNAMIMLVKSIHGSTSAIDALSKPFGGSVPEETGPSSQCRLLLTVIATRDREGFREEADMVTLNVKNSEDSSVTEVQVRQDASVAESLLYACMQLNSAEHWSDAFDSRQLKLAEDPLEITATLAHYDLRNDATLLLQSCSAGQKARIHEFVQTKCELQNASTREECSAALAKARGVKGLESRADAVETKMQEIESRTAGRSCFCVLQ